MNHLKSLSKLKDEFNKGVNIVELLNKNKKENNSTDSILISYDLQAGSYINQYRANSVFYDNYALSIANIIEKYSNSFDSIMEIGVGEATTLGNVIRYLKNKPKNIYGFDISWSRIKYAKAFMKELNIDNFDLFTGDLFNIPIKDNSIDIVYTSHSIEPNGGKEKLAIEEIYRIAKEYIILLEPCYELANDEARRRMKAHNYITNMQEAIKELNYEIVEFRLFDICDVLLNPTGLTVIKKNKQMRSKTNESPLACPITKTDLIKMNDCYYSKDGMLAYPIINDISCLLPSNAIIATHYED
jgi:ubiquinone/menaquinone biosynthesis C-methylase UbiE